MLFFLNGKFIPEQKARISGLDRGLLYGEGIFETLRSYQGKIFCLDAHLGRLFGGLKKIGITSLYNPQQLKNILFQLLQRNHAARAYIRVNITAGGLRPTTLIIMRKFSAYPRRLYLKGAKVIISRTRQNEYSPLAQVKSLNYLNFILAKNEALRKNAQEAVLLNTRGWVCEGASSNIFLARKGAIYTPAIESGCLTGITRMNIIRIARQKDVPLRETKILPGELFQAEEAFITSTLKEVMPVVKIGSRLINKGKIGPLTKMFMTEYQRLVTQETVVKQLKN